MIYKTSHNGATNGVTVCGAKCAVQIAYVPLWLCFTYDPLAIIELRIINRDSVPSTRI